MNRHVVEWTCDRCGVQVKTVAGQAQPTGWAGITLFVPAESSEPNENFGNGPTGRKHLCNRCRSEYRQWFGSLENVAADTEAVS